MSDLISRSALLESLIHCDGLGRKSFEAVIKTINEQPTVEMKSKGGWKCKPHQKRFLNRLSKQCCYESKVVEGIAHDGKCEGGMGSDKSLGYLNSYCVSCPYLKLRKVVE